MRAKGAEGDYKAGIAASQKHDARPGRAYDTSRRGLVRRVIDREGILFSRLGRSHSRSPARIESIVTHAELGDD